MEQTKGGLCRLFFALRIFAPLRLRVGPVHAKAPSRKAPQPKLVATDLKKSVETLRFQRTYMPKKSAGLLLFRRAGNSGIEVLLVHPGGPFFRKRDEGAWTIPKGEFSDDEQPLAAAKREFREELGAAPPGGEYILLKPIKQKNGKIVHAWAVEGDFDPAKLKSNTFEMEWPPKSGRKQKFPEVDRAEWFLPEVAKRKALLGQADLIDELLRVLS